MTAYACTKIFGIRDQCVRLTCAGLKGLVVDWNSRAAGAEKIWSVFHSYCSKFSMKINNFISIFTSQDPKISAPAAPVLSFGAGLRPATFFLGGGLWPHFLFGGPGGPPHSPVGLRG